MLLNEEKIFNYLNGFSGKEEKNEVESWINESDENKAEFNKLKKLYEVSGLDGSQYNPDVNKGWDVVSEQLFEAKEIQMPAIEDRQGMSLSWVMRIAAVLVLGIGLSFYFLNQSGTDEINYALSYSTESDEIKEIELADGTKVFLNENSTFRYFNKVGANRQVYLDGEAFFDVAKDPNRPFTIASKSVTTRVLGTSFNLLTSASTASVNVFSGRVAFGKLNDKNNHVILSKGEAANYGEGVTSKSSGFDNNAFAWNTGDLIFESTPISKVVMTLEKLYEVDIEFDENISNCLITSTFEEQSLAEVLEVIEIIAQIENKKNNGIIRLTGPGC